MTKFLKIFVLIFLLAFYGCASKGITKPYSEVVAEAKSKGLILPTPEEERAFFFKNDEENKEKLVKVITKRAKDIRLDAEYRIGPRDEIEIGVFDVPELNTKVTVKESGLLTLPLIGSIMAKGMTEPDLLQEVSKRLRAFVINPQISLAVSTYGSQKVAVVGAVRNPGAYPLKKGTNSVIELIGEAGGITDKAGNVINFVPAELSSEDLANDAETKARLALSPNQLPPIQSSGIEVYLENIMGTSGSIPVEIPVKGGDMVVVPEAGKIMVDGEVQKVGIYELGRQMSLLGALAAAGGITYGAKVDEVEIIRDNGGDKRAKLILDLQKISTGEERDIKLKNGDIVKIPSDSGRRLRQDTFDGITKLINFGVGGSVSLGP